MPIDTDVEIKIDARLEQAIHADIYDVSAEKLAQLRREEEMNKVSDDNGGEICGVCKQPGCRIGPMTRF